MRKLWFARILFVLAALALMAVVMEERQAQEAQVEPLRSICWDPPGVLGNPAGPELGPRACTDTRPARAPKIR